MASKISALTKFNSIILKIGYQLNILNIVVGLAIGIAHVYIPITSMLGLMLGVVMALSGSASIGISYYFTTKKSADAIKEKVTPLQSTKSSNAFIMFAIPMILLNAAASFFGMYTGTILLAGAIANPFTPAAIITASIVLGCIFAAGTLINSWLQTYHIWESLKEPVQEAPKPSATKLNKLEKIKLPVEQKFEHKIRPAPETRLSGLIGTIFSKQAAAPLAHEVGEKSEYSKTRYRP